MGVIIKVLKFLKSADGEQRADKWVFLLGRGESVEVSKGTVRTEMDETLLKIDVFKVSKT